MDGACDHAVALEVAQRERIPGAGRRTNTTLTGAGYDVVVAAARGHVLAVREYLIDQIEPRDLKALQRIGSAVDAAIDRGRTAPAAAPPVRAEPSAP